MMKNRSLSNYVILLVILAGLVSCNGQPKVKEPAPKKQIPDFTRSEDLNLKFEKGILSIFQDSKHNYWIGSKEEGVCKYDGEKYEYFTTTEGLTHNTVRNIQEDQKGNIWLSTGNGVCYYDGETFNTLSSDKEANEASVWSLSKNDLWFPIHNDGILRYRFYQLEYLPIPVPKEDKNYAEDRVQEPYFYPYAAVTIYQDKDKKLLIGTFNRGVLLYDGEKFEYHNPDNFGVGTIRGLFQDKKGNYWFGSNGGGLYKYDGANYINLTKEWGLTSRNRGYDEAGTLSRVWSIEQDVNGDMWFGTADSGLWKYDGTELINYSIKDGLPSNFVETIFKDKNGKLWFCSGMNSNGILYNFDGQSFSIINP